MDRGKEELPRERVAYPSDMWLRRGTSNEGVCILQDTGQHHSCDAGLQELQVCFSRGIHSCQ